MRDVKTLTPGEKESIAKHYLNSHHSLVHKLIETAAGMVAQNDSLGLLWLSETAKATLEAAISKLPDDESEEKAKPTWIGPGQGIC